MGLGLNGGGLLSAQFCLACGAEVLVTDLNSEDRLASSLTALRDFAPEALGKGRLRFRLGCHKLEDFQQADLVIKNPGVPSHSPYLQAARRWTSDLALFLELYPQVPVLAITGTKGKSSISYALHYILQQYLPEAMLGGNIGASPLSYALDELQARRSLSAPLVLELSSWQLADLRAVETSRGQVFFRPQQACLSNILKDHQNRYARFCDYVADKFYIFKNMARLGLGELLLGTPADAMYLGPQFWGDFAARAFGASCHYFSLEAALPKGLESGLYWLADGNAYIRQPNSEQLFLERQGFALMGQHSFQNYGIASYMAYRFLQKRKISDLRSFCLDNKQLMRKFRGVPFRMELRGRAKLGKHSTLYFINDTTATMPDATVLGLETCLEKSHCLLIAGGTDKDLDPGKLLASLLRHQGHYTLFLLQGNGTEALIKRLEQAGLPYAGFASLRSAFQAATAQATAQAAQHDQQYLLLSPGYASFGMFQNEFDRGREFNTLVAEYLENDPTAQ